MLYGQIVTTLIIDYGVVRVLRPEVGLKLVFNQAPYPYSIGTTYCMGYPDYWYEQRCYVPKQYADYLEFAFVPYVHVMTDSGDVYLPKSLNTTVTFVAPVVEGRMYYKTSYESADGDLRPYRPDVEYQCIGYMRNGNHYYNLRIDSGSSDYASVHFSYYGPR